MVQASNKLQKMTQVVQPHDEDKGEQIARRKPDVDIAGKRRRGWPNLRWKDVCKRHMREMGLKEDKTTNRAA